MAFRRACKKTAEYLDSKEFEVREDAGMTNKGDFVSLLIDINNFGYLTYDSQEGFNHNNVISERAYVCGWMETKHAREFINRLNALTDKVGFLVAVSDIDSRIPVTVNFGKPEWLKRYDTDEFSDKDRKELKKHFEEKKKLFKKRGFTAETRLSTTIPLETYENEWKNYVKLPKKEMKKHSMVVCFDPKYNRRSDRKGGLLYDIIDVLEGV